MENKDITKEGPLTHKDLLKDNSLNNFEDLDFETLDLMVLMRRQARQQPQPSLLDYQRMYTPERETPVGNLAAEAGFGKSKFDKGLTDINQLYDLDDIRGSNQRWYDQLGNASVKMVSLAGTTFLQGTLGFAWGAGTAIKDWRVSGLWDNAVSQGIAEFTEWTEEVLPNYYSDYEKEGPWYKHFWTSNFWGDKFLKNLGFTIGAYYSGQVFANMMSNMKFRGLANVFGKSLEGAENAARASEQLAFTNNILGKIGKKGILESSKRAAKTANIPQQITAAIGATTSAMAEGTIEAVNGTRAWEQEQLMRAEDGYKERREEAIRKYEGNPKLKSTLEQIDKDHDDLLAEILIRKAQMGNMILGLNIPVLSISNLIQFGRQFGKEFTTARSLKSNISKAGTKLISKMSTPKGVVRALMNPLSEGMEEFNQELIETWAGTHHAANVESFNKLRIDPDGEELVVDIINTFQEAWAENISSGETWEQFWVGAMTGALGMPVFGKTHTMGAWTGSGKAVGLQGGVVGEMIQYKLTQSEVNEVIDYINENAISEKALEYYRGLILQETLGKKSEIAVEENDIFNFKNSEYGKLIADIIKYDRAGDIEGLVAMIENSHDTSQKALEALVASTLEMNEDGSPKLVDGKKVGTFYRDGLSMLATEAGTNEMIETLNKSKDNLINEVENYLARKFEIDIVTGQQFSEDQLAEVMFLDRKLANFELRTGELGKDIKPIVSKIIQGIDSYVSELNERLDVYQESESATPEKIEAKKKIIEEFLKYKDQLVENLAKSDIEFAESISQWTDMATLYNLASDIHNLPKTKGILSSLDLLNFNKLGTELRDTFIHKDAYESKLDSYMNNPGMVEADIRKGMNEVIDLISEAHVDAIGRDINTVEQLELTLQTVDPRVKEAILKKLQTSKDSNIVDLARKYNEIQDSKKHFEDIFNSLEENNDTAAASRVVWKSFEKSESLDLVRDAINEYKNLFDPKTDKGTIDAIDSIMKNFDKRVELAKRDLPDPTVPKKPAEQKDDRSNLLKGLDKAGEVVKKGYKAAKDKLGLNKKGKESITDKAEVEDVDLAGEAEVEIRRQEELLENSSPKENIKPGVLEVFESNPELANDVYEALGFKTKADVILPIGTSGSGKSTFIKSLSQENLVVIEPDAMRVEFTGDMNNKSKDKEIYKEAAKRAVTAIKQGKQVVFDTTNLTKDKRLPFIKAIKEAIPAADIQYKLMELNPELAKQRIKAQLARGENRAAVSDETIDRHAASYKQMLVDIKNEPISNFEITPQQKQQAQQLYSQYLDTIFPDSKEDRILAHASHATNIEKFEKRPNKNFFGFAQLGRGVYLTDLYGLDYWRYELGLGKGEGKNYYVKVNLQNTVGVDNYITDEMEASLSENVDAVYENMKPHEKEDNWKPYHYAVRNPEKIHILGSKQDIEGFKKFVEESNLLGVWSKNTNQITPQQIADIERRRQEELNNYFSLKSLQEAAKDFFKYKYNFQPGTTALGLYSKNTGDSVEDLKYLNRKDASKIIETSPHPDNTGYVKDKKLIEAIKNKAFEIADKEINAKYDAEIAALEAQEKSDKSVVFTTRKEIDTKKADKVTDTNADSGDRHSEVKSTPVPHLTNFVMTKYAIHPLMNPNDRTAIRMHSPIVDALDNLGAFNFVDEGHLGRMLNKNRELKIHYVLSQNPKLLDNVLLAVEVTTDMASITENAITVDGVRYQVVGAVGVPKGNKIAGQNFDTLRTDLNIELNLASEVGDYFVSKEHYNHVKHIYSGRMVRSMNEHLDASVKPLNRQFPGLEKNKPLHLGFYYSGTDFRTPTLDISESVVPLNRHNDPMPGSVWMMTQEADGLWYSKLLNVSRLNPNSFNLTEKMNTRFILDILGGIETLLNESLSETERLAGWDAIHDRLFYELDEKGERKKFINFNKSKDGGDDIIKIHEGPNTTPTEVVMENGLSLQERAQAVLEALWVSKANLRFQVSPNLALDLTYMDDLLLAEILTTDLARTHNLNASFDLFLYDRNSEGPTIPKGESIGEVGHTGIKAADPSRIILTVTLNSTPYHKRVDGSIVTLVDSKLVVVDDIDTINIIETALKARGKHDLVIGNKRNGSEFGIYNGLIVEGAELTRLKENIAKKQARKDQAKALKETKKKTEVESDDVVSDTRESILDKADTELIIETSDNTVTYNLGSQGQQTYTIEGNKILNSKGVEVFKNDSKNRRKIYANYAVKLGRAVIVEVNGTNYVVNNKGEILSTKTGNFVFSDTNHGVGIRIRQAAQERFNQLLSKQTTTVANRSAKLVVNNLESGTKKHETASGQGLVIGKTIGGSILNVSEKQQAWTRFYETVNTYPGIQLIMKKLGIDTMEQFSEKVMKERGINPEVMNNEHIEALLDYLKNC